MQGDPGTLLGGRDGNHRRFFLTNALRQGPHQIFAEVEQALASGTTRIETVGTERRRKNRRSGPTARGHA